MPGPALSADRVSHRHGRGPWLFADLSLTVLTKRPGDEVKVEFKRDGKDHTVTVKLGNRPNTPVQ